MKAGIIAPIPNIELGDGEFHLLLSHMCTRRAYVDFYKEQKAQGAYIVLDNSAHESGTGSTASKLLVYGSVLGADEIVMPDVLFDCEGTLKATQAAFEYMLTDGYQMMTDLRPRLMMVPQGKDIEGFRTCLMGQMLMWNRYSRLDGDIFGGAPVIGLSKDFEIWEGGLEAILDNQLEPLHRKDGIDLHLLGWGRNLWALPHLRERFDWIRSTDSAKPIVYALGGINLSTHSIADTPPVYPGRMQRYFDFYLDGEALRLAKKNIDVFRGFAGGR